MNHQADGEKIMAGLQGLRVLDISTGIAGPFCAKLLADGGATVIKIEAPDGGDSSRQEGAFVREGDDHRTSSLFVFLNQNKQGVSLDITSVSGREIFKRLVAISDVVVESFQPGTMAELGLGYSDLAAVNPGIVLASLTDFGQTGPYGRYKGDHLAISALGGWAYNFGDPGREPLQVGIPVMYYMAGIHGAIGILAAIRGRRADGKGQHVDVSAQEACMNMLSYPQLAEQFNSPLPQRNFAGQMGFYVQAKDGWVALNYLSAGQWGNLLLLVGVPHLAEDPTLLYDYKKRQAIMPEIIAAANEWAKEKTVTEAFYAAQELQIPAGIAYTPKDIIASDQLNVRDFFIKTSQAGLGEFVQPRNPFPSLSLRADRQPAPDLGQDNQEVLGNLGLQPKDLRALRNSGVI
jgi:crotonobetainyl-CoA:carnitine CoA-transferase CaiB-like acyl-CoA transferase